MTYKTMKERYNESKENNSKIKIELPVEHLEKYLQKELSMAQVKIRRQLHGDIQLQLTGNLNNIMFFLNKVGIKANE